MNVYLANPYGFSKQLSKRCLPEIIEKIEWFGHNVVGPFRRIDRKILFFEEFRHLASDPYNIGQFEKQWLTDCDAIFAIVNGNPPDEGVMVELGMAIALNKKIYLFRDDFRRCTDSEVYPLNLMLFCGLPKDNWKDYYFTSVDEIKL